jgi:hypothetical protein
MTTTATSTRLSWAKKDPDGEDPTQTSGREIKLMTCSRRLKPTDTGIFRPMFLLPGSFNVKCTLTPR